MEEPSAVDVRVLRESLGLSAEQFARITGYAVTDIQAWEEGRPVNTPAMQRMKEFQRLFDALAGIMSPALVPAWMQSPLEQFNYHKPVELIANGEIDLLWRFIGAAEVAARNLKQTE